MQTVFNVRTTGAGLHEFTDEVVRFVRGSGVREGLLTLFVQHTSCSLLVQENADPDVRRDLQEFFRRLVPSSDDPSMRGLAHTTERRDDMPAHIEAMLTAVSLSIPMMGRRSARGRGSICSNTATGRRPGGWWAFEWLEATKTDIG